MRKVIIIGDASHNTLSAVRSFGEAGIGQVLVLVAVDDPLFVHKSKYLRGDSLRRVGSLDECDAVLAELVAAMPGATLMTTFDAAAEWVDAREPQLSRSFRTPCRGRQLGPLFNKAAQCRLALECGLDVPRSVVYERGDPLSSLPVGFPLLTKPLVSSLGEKGDIHICRDMAELEAALAEHSHCRKFLLQQFIEKEYEIDAVGVSTDEGVVMGGAVHKYRHWPPLVGAGAYGVFERMDTFNVDVAKVEAFLVRSGYHGPFSVEFLHTKDGRNYFMEVNFRNEGLAYASTCAGANLHALYVDPTRKINWRKFRRTYMMNYSIDLLYVKEGRLSLWRWVRDLLRTRCFINICFHDLGPVLAYYRNKKR